jgi:hypothetical protein
MENNKFLVSSSQLHVTCNWELANSIHSVLKLLTGLANAALMA